MRETRGALARWNADPLPVLGAWVAGALAVACAMLLGVWIVGAQTTPDVTPLYIPGLDGEADPGDVGRDPVAELAGAGAARDRLRRRLHRRQLAGVVGRAA